MSHSGELRKAYAQQARVRGVPPWSSDLLVSLLTTTGSVLLLLPLGTLLGEGDSQLLFGPLVVVLGAWRGLRCSILAATWSLMLGILLLRVHAFTSPELLRDVLSLVVFVGLGVVLGWGGHRFRVQVADSTVRELESSMLFALGQSLSMQASPDDLSRILGGFLESTFPGVRGAVTVVGSETPIQRPPWIAPQLLAEVEAKQRFLAERPQEMDSSQPALVQASLMVGAMFAPDGSLQQRQGTDPAVSPALGEATGHAAEGEALSGRLTSLSLQGSGSEASPPDQGVCILVSSRGVEAVGWLQGTPETLVCQGMVRMLRKILPYASLLFETLALRDLAAQANTLRETARIKGHVVRSVSHELKTPLASVTAVVTSLLAVDRPWSEFEARSQLHVANTALTRLNEGITALLDLSRLSSGAWAPDRHDYELGEILGTVLKRLPAESRHRVSVALPEGLPPFRVDFAQWVRLLCNLLENALVYSGDENVEVGAAVVDGKVQCWVADRGPGLASDELELIFEKFHRGSQSARRPSGTGLGLAICREIVGFHEGRLWAEQRVGGGARFVVEIQDDGEHIELPDEETAFTPKTVSVSAPPHSSPSLLRGQGPSEHSSEAAYPQATHVAHPLRV